MVDYNLHCPVVQLQATKCVFFTMENSNPPTKPLGPATLSQSLASSHTSEAHIHFPCFSSGLRVVCSRAWCNQTLQHCSIDQSETQPYTLWLQIKKVGILMFGCWKVIRVCNNLVSGCVLYNKFHVLVRVFSTYFIRRMWKIWQDRTWLDQYSCYQGCAIIQYIMY